MCPFISNPNPSLGKLASKSKFPPNFGPLISNPNPPLGKSASKSKLHAYELSDKTDLEDYRVIDNQRASAFAKENKFKVLAECVETKEELETVIRLGVDLIQGYYTSRPKADIIDNIEEEIQTQIIQFNRAV